MTQNNKFYGSILESTGSYLPNKIITNEELSKIVDTNDEWITSRTGIKQRHIAEDFELTSDLATKAAKDCLQNSKLLPTDIDLIIVATTTPDKTFPATATIVQSKLGINKGAAFDIQAVCAGFIFALATADSMIKSGLATNALVIGAETMSRILDWKDRTTCVLFGDGAGAVIISKNQDNNRGIIASDIHSNGTYTEILNTSGGVSSTQQSGSLFMNGREVFKHATEKMSSSMLNTINKAEMTIDQIDLIIPHQANVRILDYIGKKLKLPKAKIVVKLDQHANTSAASVPLALDAAFKEKKLSTGDNILLSALGGGLSWGSILLKI